MRKVISQRMRESLDTSAQAVHRIDVDMSEAVRMRTMLKTDDIAVSYNDIIIKTAAAALARHPRMNSRLTDEGIVEIGEVNVGMAVAVDDGLLVPVIRNTDQLGMAEIHAESRRLAEGARLNTLKPDDLQNGTFSVSNLGMFDLDSFTAIINSPESGILAVGAIKEKAVVVDGDIVPRPICSLSLTYDHRVIDGAPAADFLRDIKMLLENPYRLL
jgi:pyruvate dehydrogenase E2 component (dihydrolipoamide acetyltransferase)